MLLEDQHPGIAVRVCQLHGIHIAVVLVGTCSWSVAVSKAKGRTLQRMAKALVSPWLLSITVRLGIFSVCLHLDILPNV